MTEAEALAAYRAELRAQLRRLPALQRSAIERVLQELKQVRDRILAELAGPLSDSRRAARTRLFAEIEQQMAGWARAAAAVGQQSTALAWTAGIELVSRPIAAALGVSVATRIDPRAVAMVDRTLTSAIADASAASVRRINAVIREVVIGATTTPDAIAAIGRILESPGRRAQTILFTELGRAHAMAGQAAMIEAAQKVPGLRKRWVRSGKLNPRADHVRAHNQTVLAGEFFTVAGERMRHPRDPNASAANTVNCGCMAVPVVDGSTIGASRVSIDRAGAMSVVRRPVQTDAEATLDASVLAAQDAGLIVTRG